MDLSGGLVQFVTSQRALACNRRVFSDCNEHYYRFSDLFPLFPHRLLSARNHFTPFKMVEIYHSSSDRIQNALFFPHFSLRFLCVQICARTLHCFPAHFSGHSFSPLFFSLLLAHKSTTPFKTDTNLRECYQMALQNVHVSPMMMNTLGKVPVYFVDVCDRIPF